ADRSGSNAYGDVAELDQFDIQKRIGLPGGETGDQELVLLLQDSEFPDRAVVGRNIEALAPIQQIVAAGAAAETCGLVAEQPVIAAAAEHAVVLSVAQPPLVPSA